MFRFPIILIFTLCVYATGYSQCYPERHTTNAYDGWVSCDANVHPDFASRGPGHWIQYDFGSNQSLHDMVIWNINHPIYLDDGIKNLIIEYKPQNGNWVLHDTVTLHRAPASGYYQGMTGPDLGGVNARYLLLTAVDNYGGSCYGLSEIKVYTTEQNSTEFNLDITACEADGVLKNIHGGMDLGGTFSGPGVIDNNDETFDFDISVAGIGSHQITYVYNGGNKVSHITVVPCDNALCVNCPQCGKFDPSLVNAHPIPENTYHDMNLTTSGVVASNQPVNLRGKYEVNMDPGFEVEPNVDFAAEIRECNNNLFQNEGFENDGSNWYLFENSNANASVNYVTTNPHTGNKCARVQVNSTGGTVWYVQLIQSGFSIEQGKDYTISFMARSDDEADFTIYAQMDYAPWTAELVAPVALTENWQFYTFSFTASQSLDGEFNGGLRIAPNMGEYTGTFYFDQFQFYENE